mmetsp:Transcript_5389/g.12176  ORF Transcript_5389/g.12176 Transcript_5389/m.12176 type:complete len:226 (+) Transcript_5389:1581-2258(+)
MHSISLSPVSAVHSAFPSTAETTLPEDAPQATASPMPATQSNLVPRSHFAGALSFPRLQTQSSSLFVAPARYLSREKNAQDRSEGVLALTESESFSFPLFVSNTFTVLRLHAATSCPLRLNDTFNISAGRLTAATCVKFWATPVVFQAESAFLRLFCDNPPDKAGLVSSRSRSTFPVLVTPAADTRVCMGGAPFALCRSSRFSASNRFIFSSYFVLCSLTSCSKV